MSAHLQPSHELYRPFVEHVLQRFSTTRGGITLAVTSPASGDGVTYVVSGMLQAFRDVVRDRVTVVTLSSIQVELRSRLAALPRGGTEPTRESDSQSETSSPASHSKADIRRSCLEQLTSSFDIVLIDAPPLSASGDLFGFASSFDGIVLVLSAGRTTRDQLVRSEAHLVQAGGLIEGHIFNQRRKPVRRMLSFNT